MLCQSIILWQIFFMNKAKGQKIYIVILLQAYEAVGVWKTDL